MIETPVRVSSTINRRTKMNKGKKVTPKFTYEEYRLLNFVMRISHAFSDIVETILTRGFMTEDERFSLGMIEELNSIDIRGKSQLDRIAA